MALRVSATCNGSIGMPWITAKIIINHSSQRQRRQVYIMLLWVNSQWSDHYYLVVAIRASETKS